MVWHECLLERAGLGLGSWVLGSGSRSGLGSGLGSGSRSGSGETACLGVATLLPVPMRTLAIACLLLCGCIELDEFPNESIVTGPRVLAVVIEPPEVTPGASLSVSTLVVGAEDVSIEYRICGAFDGPFGGAQFGDRDDESCSDQTLLRGSGPTWTIPAELLAAFWANADLAEAVLGGTLSSETIEIIRTSVGIPLQIEISVRADGKTLRAVKRVLLSENPEPHANPPPPAFDFGKHPVNADPDAAWSCSADEPLTVKPAQRIELAPSVVDGEETWIEPYRVINAKGEVQERTERAFYAWFATAGKFESHSTRAPLRNDIWTAPQKPGPNRLWLVVRDGHGGASACGVDIRVGR